MKRATLTGRWKSGGRIVDSVCEAGVRLAKKGLSPKPFPAKNRQAVVIGYIEGMWNLTREQRRVICAVILLLVVGWGVKAWRLAHPPARNAVVSVP